MGVRNFGFASLLCHSIPVRPRASGLPTLRPCGKLEGIIIVISGNHIPLSPGFQKRWCLLYFLGKNDFETTPWNYRSLHPECYTHLFAGGRDWFTWFQREGEPDTTGHILLLGRVKLMKCLFPPVVHDILCTELKHSPPLHTCINAPDQVWRFSSRSRFRGPSQSQNLEVLWVQSYERDHSSHAAGKVSFLSTLSSGR